MDGAVLATRAILWSVEGGAALPIYNHPVWMGRILLPALFLSKILISSHPFHQGWEFAHLISPRIACFLSKNERMSDSLKK